MEEENKYEDFLPPKDDISYDKTQSTTGFVPDEDVTKEFTQQHDNPSENTTPSVEETVTNSIRASNSESSMGSPKDVPNTPDWQAQLDSRLEAIDKTEQRIFSEVKEIHKLYHTEFSGRLKSMQEELEQYRKLDKGRAYDDILSAIARIYGTNESLPDEVEDQKAKKNIKYMLLDLEELLGDYGMNKQRSEPGEKRNTRHCQVLNRISTDDPALHDTIAKSYNPGFYIGNRTIIKELVDIYFYDGASSLSSTEDNQIIENC